MPVCERPPAPAPSAGDKKVLSFVAEDGTVVRQEITIRTQKGKNEIMTMDLPPEPSPSSSETSDCSGDRDPAVEYLSHNRTASEEEEEHMGSVYLSKDSSRELSFPHPSSTACRIPF